MVGVLPHLAKLRGIALDLLFPQRCIACGKEGELLCHSCLQSLPRIMAPLCPLCGRPQPGGILCHRCVKWQAGIDGIRSPLKFEGLVRQAIHQLKYRNLKAMAKPLATLLADYWLNNPVPGRVLIPVPLNSKRLRERGYNQSALLANELGKLSGLPIVDDCLSRPRYTIPQTKTATAEQRQKNVAGSFLCRNQDLSGQEVVLIDDVTTSGATLNACAVALKEGGAISVWGLTVAREI